jgi:hypothetical protein
MKKILILFIAGLLLTSCCYVPSQTEGRNIANAKCYVPSHTEGTNITPVKESVAIMPPSNTGPKDIKFTEFTHNGHKWYLVRIFYDVQTVIHSPDCPCNNK